VDAAAAPLPSPDGPARPDAAVSDASPSDGGERSTGVLAIDGGLRPPPLGDAGVGAFMVRLGYVLPVDREPRPEATARIGALVKEMQRFYADQMERHGFGRKTFTYESDATGPIVHTVRSRRTLAEITGNNADTYWNGVIAAAREGGLPVGRNNEIWFLVSGANRQQPNGRSEPDHALGNKGPSGNNNGIAIVQDPVLVYARMLADDRDLHGEILSDLGPYPIDRKAYRSFQTTIASWQAGNVIGAAAHELGHALRMNHQYRNDGQVGPQGFQHQGSIMGNAFRGYRGYARPESFAIEPHLEDTRLARAEALQLALSPFFDRERVRVDRTRPRVRLGTSAGVLAPKDGLVQISVEAEEPEDGARGSGIALITLFNGDADVAHLDLPDRPRRVQAVLRTPHFSVDKTSTWRVRVIDGDFNETEVALDLTISGGANRAPRPFIVTPTNLVKRGAPVSFDGARKSRDPDGDTMTYRWELSDGAVSDRATLVHTFAQLGTVTVRLRVTDGKGASADEEMQLLVTP
jgi:hypothetical protein